MAGVVASRDAVHEDGVSGVARKEAGLIELQAVMKRCGETVVVDEVSLRVLPGRVTALLGPNGAGKPTAMLLVLGPGPPYCRSGVGRRQRYRDLGAPLLTVGALLGADAMHPDHVPQGGVDGRVSSARSVCQAASTSGARPGRAGSARAARCRDVTTPKTGWRSAFWVATFSVCSSQVLWLRR